MMHTSLDLFKLAAYINKRASFGIAVAANLFSCADVHCITYLKMDIPFVPTSEQDLTENWFKQVLKFEFSHDDTIIIKELKVSLNSTTTDGFLSIMYKAHVKACSEKYPAVERVWDLLVKMYPLGEFHKKLVRYIGAFEREIHA
jgi:hypothetical protein